MSEQNARAVLDALKELRELSRRWGRLWDVVPTTWEHVHLWEEAMWVL